MVVEISDWNDLDNVRNDLTGDYVLVNGLDKDTAGYTGIGDDFEPIGFVSGNREGDMFSGVLDGDGFQISDLVIEENNSTEGGVAFITQVGNGGLVENLSVYGTVNSTIGDIFYGGLAASVAFSDGPGTIQNCVSHVDVTALDGSRVGGLVGGNSDTVTDSYATGSVEGDERVGGLVGFEMFGTVTDSYWDTETTGQSTSDGGTGLTTAQMQGSEAETNMNFDFANVWSTVEGDIDIEFDTIDGQITLDDVAAETATVILHNFSEPESIGGLVDGYPILLSVDEDEQLESQNAVVRNIARTETDTNGNYSAEIPGATGDTIAIAVDFDDGTDRYGRLVTTVIE